MRRSLRSGLIPLIDSTKTTGLVFFPGTMVGMLLAGAAPVDAVRLQLILLYVLLGAVALATLLAVILSGARSSPQHTRCVNFPLTCRAAKRLPPIAALAPPRTGRLCNRGYTTVMARPVDHACWVLLAYRLPREPSAPRLAVWRKLKRLGAAQLVDGLVALPLDSRNRAQLAWMADDVLEAGGQSWLWIARPGTAAQERAL